MRIYFGRVAWGWRMYGIGWKCKWFMGFSMALDVEPPADYVNNAMNGFNKDRGENWDSDPSLNGFRERAYRATREVGE